MNSRESSVRWFAVGMIAAVVLGGSAFFAGWMFQRGDASSELSLPMILNADSSSTGKSISVATGPVGNGMEGLFLLDHTNGNLFCVLINPRSGLEAATYRANVFEALNVVNAADVDLVMTTGFLNLAEGGRAGNSRPASCLCYVADGNTGLIAGYGFQFVPQAVEQGIPQGGFLRVLWRGATRAASFGTPPAGNPPPLPAVNGSDKN